MSKKDTNKVEKKKVGAPKAKIDWEDVKYMLNCGCTTVEIAAALGVYKETLTDRCVGENFDENGNPIPWVEFKQIHKAAGANILRVAQFENAKKGNVQMQIWLGKQRLKQTEKQEIVQKIVKIDSSTLKEEEVTAAYSEMIK